MRKESEICPKIVFGTFLVTFEIEGGDLAKKGTKEGILICQCGKWKNSLL